MSILTYSYCIHIIIHVLDVLQIYIEDTRSIRESAALYLRTSLVLSTYIYTYDLYENAQTAMSLRVEVTDWPRGPVLSGIA